MIYPDYDINNILTGNRLLFGYFDFQNFNNFIKQGRHFYGCIRLYFSLSFSVLHRVTVFAEGNMDGVSVYLDLTCVELCDEGNVSHASQQEAHYYFICPSFPMPFSKIRKISSLNTIGHNTFFLFIYKLYVDTYKHFHSNKLGNTWVSTHKT